MFKFVKDTFLVILILFALVLIKLRVIRPTPFNKNSCLRCGCEYLSPLRSLNTKKCTSCGHEMDWNLDPGQLPLVRSNRMVKRDKP